MVTDDRNTWAPERLDNEHDLFIVFQSVKFRNYYLSCDGSGKVRLQQIINQAYREPNQLFITIDPGTFLSDISKSTYPIPHSAVYYSHDREWDNIDSWSELPCTLQQQKITNNYVLGIMFNVL